MKILWSTAAIALSAALWCHANEDGTGDSDGDVATWADVYLVIADTVYNPEASEHLFVLTQDLEFLATDGAVEEFNALLDIYMDDTWTLTEESMILTYDERDAVDSALMAVVSTLQDGTTRWQRIDVKPKKKCIKPRKAECKTRDQSNCVIKRKQVKEDGKWVDKTPIDERCHTEARPRE